MRGRDSTAVCKQSIFKNSRGQELLILLKIMEKPAKIVIYKDLILTQDELAQIYDVETQSFAVKYFVPLCKFIETKLKFIATSNKKENHPNSVTFQLKCLTCKNIASATIKRHKILEKNVIFTFKSSCNHYTGMYMIFVE